MATIGILQATHDGGWAGAIFLLGQNIKIRLAANDKREAARAPAYRIFAGQADLGAAWKNQTNESSQREFLGCEIEVPGINDSISFAIFFNEDGKTARAVWRSARPEKYRGKDG